MEVLLLQEFRQNGINVDYYSNFLDTDEGEELYTTLSKAVPSGSRRTGLTFGDEELVYVVTYHGKTSHRKTLPWSGIQGLEKLKRMVEDVTGQTYNVCAVLKYPNGGIGINPHRDKEMVAGTSICGVSLGAERTISFAGDIEKT